MCSSRYLAGLLFVCGSALATEGFMVGAGAESDSDGGLSFAVIGSVGFTDDTWLSAGYALSDVDLVSGRELETRYADIELDHYFGPLGVRIGAA